MEKVLDKVVTVIFIIALIAILYFVGKFVMDKMGRESTADNNVGQVDDNNPFSDEEDVDDTFDSEDADYYRADEEDKAVPKGYDDEIAKIMGDVVSDAEEKVADAADAVANGAEDAKEAAVETAKAIKEKVTEDKPKSATDTKVAAETSSNNSASSVDDSSKYMVVAGSFTSNANADKHAAKLEKEGFTPEIVNFNNSRMYTVIASRHDTEADALVAAKKIRTKKIECYVQRKRLK